MFSQGKSPGGEASVNAKNLAGRSALLSVLWQLIAYDHALDACYESPWPLQAREPTAATHFWPEEVPARNLPSSCHHLTTACALFRLSTNHAHRLSRTSRSIGFGKGGFGWWRMRCMSHSPPCSLWLESQRAEHPPLSPARASAAPRAYQRLSSSLTVRFECSLSPTPNPVLLPQPVSPSGVMSPPVQLLIKLRTA